MTRRTPPTTVGAIVASIVGVALVIATASCQLAPDDDVCVPPTPSTTGAPWVEQDDGDPCIRDGIGGWTEAADGHPRVKSTTRAGIPVTTGTRAPFRKTRATTRSRRTK